MFDLAAHAACKLIENAMRSRGFAKLSSRSVL